MALKKKNNDFKIEPCKAKILSNYVGKVDMYIEIIRRIY